MKTLKTFLKPFEASQRRLKIKLIFILQLQIISDENLCSGVKFYLNNSYSTKWRHDSIFWLSGLHNENLRFVLQLRAEKLRKQCFNPKFFVCKVWPIFKTIMWGSYLNFYFRTFLWCLKRLYENIKDLSKTFWGITKTFENKINFYFTTSNYFRRKFMQWGEILFE